ncbi:MAG: hypothetical protein CV087_10635 [Candidatus Brocadia sp. WS118]|nr:MAG: hypothetical protein CV087_10635 [Candidatus Brocadia sp. WS118]
MNREKKLEFWPGTAELTMPARKVAKILSVHPNTLFRWAKAGKIECVRYGRNSIHFTYDQILEFIDRHREQVKINI